MALLKNCDSAASPQKDGSLDNAVQRTNDDSVVSKRSAVFHKYIEDPYLRHFVKKLSRRSPLINRGYYLRMLVITDLVETCICHFQSKIPSGAAQTPVQVISLGAGYDTLAMRLKEKPDYSNVVFYEVDFLSVMKSKAEWLRAAPKGSFPSDIVAEPDAELVTLRSVNYYAIGADLRDNERGLLNYLAEASTGFSAAHPTVLYAECVMQYMPPLAAGELIKHVARSFSSAIFIAYDQINPTDSFGEVMKTSLRAKGSPLLGLAETPNGAAMLRRAMACGMQQAKFANFHDLSLYYLTGDELRRVEALEPFDESEEWCEMCEHYGVTMAATSDKIGLPLHPSFVGTTDKAANESRCTLEKVTVRAEKWPNGRFGFEGWGNGQAFAEKLPFGDVLLVSFGGFCATRSHQRTNVVYVYGLFSGENYKVVAVNNSVEPPALVFHSVSRIARGEYLVLGGRTNPRDVTMDAYLLQLNLPEEPHEQYVIGALWVKLPPSAPDAESPEARFRHSATAVGKEDLTSLATSTVIPSVGQRVFVFGGRNKAGLLLNDAWLATIGTKVIYWSRIQLSGEAPPHCCSSAVIPLHGGTTVLLSGGLLAEGVCEGSVWRIDWATGVCCKVPLAFIPRFSHTMCHVQVNGVARVLVLGGSMCHPRDRHPLAVLLDAETGAMASALSLPSECPTWTRHCCVTLGEGVVAVLGGGFTCFSFGTFAAKPLLLFLGDKTSCEIIERRQHMAAAVTPPQEKPLFCSSLSFKRAGVDVLAFSSDAFMNVVRRPSRPVVFCKTDLGRCLELWANPKYLKEAEGEKIVSVHVARQTNMLDFVKKNFVFQHVCFAELVDHCVAAAAEKRQAENSELWYLRSVAVNMKSERSNLWKDFPGLGADFLLPAAAAEHIEPRMHQACLRLSAPPLQLWTHYDTLDNVLCQIVGRKRVVLFPPSQYNNLYMSGSSSAVLNIDAPDLERFPRFADALRNSIEVILEPGDMIFLPSLWFHHITTLEGSYSISVNVFFERFNKESYDNKDLYGNKDLPAVVQLRKRIVDQVKQLVTESSTAPANNVTRLTSDFAEFALRQAIQDLEEVADIMAASRQWNNY